MLDPYMIAWLRFKGIINIDPFVPECLGPNSYDVHLGPWIAEVDPGYDRDFCAPVGPRAQHLRWTRITDDGFQLLPGRFYLGSTVEVAGTIADVVPHIDGRSSVGRMGMRVHATAGRGDVGFVGHWTLEIDVAGASPVWVFPGLRVGQLSFYPLFGHAIPRPPAGDTVFTAQGFPGGEAEVRGLRYKGRYHDADLSPHAAPSRFVHRPSDVPPAIARAVAAIGEVYPPGVRNTQTPAEARAAFDAYRTAIYATRPEGADERARAWLDAIPAREEWGR